MLATQTTEGRNILPACSAHACHEKKKKREASLPALVLLDEGMVMTIIN